MNFDGDHCHSEVGLERHNNAHYEKGPVIIPTNAVIEPFAVVIKVPCTPVASSAMLRVLRHRVLAVRAK